MDTITGAFIGVVVGLVAGIIGAILINSIFDPKSDVKAVLSICAALGSAGLAIWQSQWIKDLMMASQWVIPSFCATFVLTILYPAVRTILVVGRNIGRGSTS